MSTKMSTSKLIQMSRPTFLVFTIVVLDIKKERLDD